MTPGIVEEVRHLYIHIPFCPSKCSYCAFETHIGSLKLAGRYVDAMIRELRSHAHEGRGGTLKTVYFGGGTPSMLAPADIARILHATDSAFGLDAFCEITLEAHPATVDASNLRGFRTEGVTRMSFGGESLDASELLLVGRGHSPEQVLQAVAMARDAGIESLGLDLIYGLPGQTMASWQRTLELALQAKTDHLSLYPLSVEPKTVMARRQHEGRLALPDDDAVVAMYQRACLLLRAAGYEHYEVANWARSGHRCRHNLAYWRDRQYFGIGVGAHGYISPHRTVNLSGTKRYIEYLESGRSPVVEWEEIDASAQLEEYVMLRLRLLTDGLSLREMRSRFGDVALRRVQERIRPLAAAGLVSVTGDVVRLAEDAAPIANEIWERLAAA